jgi:glutamate/tyrosine decarboxylase-like PLP-dependent enzyme
LNEQTSSAGNGNPYASTLRQAFESAQRYLATVGDRHVGVTPSALEAMLQLGGALSDQGEEAESVLAILDEFGSPATMAIMGRRFFGGVIGGSLPVTIAAHWIADAWDQNACLYELSPVSAYIEENVLQWIIDILGLPNGSGGALVTGTQMADVTALAAARHSLLNRAGWDVEADGLFGAPPITVIVGEEVHATMLKALALIGFGRKRVVVVPADAQGRMIPSQIPKVAGPTIICTQLGNVNSGACDPIDEICDVALSMDAWVHVDGAFGLWAAATPLRKHLVEGVSRAHSWATDGHKWLNTPQDCGIAVVRDAQALHKAMTISAAYYGIPGRRDPMQWCPESSRRARGIEVWAALRFLGKQGLAGQIETTCALAEAFAGLLRNAGCEILNDVVLNQVLVAFGDDERTQRVIDGVQQDGVCWCGGTLWRGRKAMRISVCSWATTREDIERSAESIIAKSLEISGSCSEDRI